MVHILVTGGLGYIGSHTVVELIEEEVERDVIQKAVDKYHGNISKAAKELGLTRASLYRRLEKHGI